MPVMQRNVSPVGATRAAVCGEPGRPFGCARRGPSLDPAPGLCAWGLLAPSWVIERHASACNGIVPPWVSKSEAVGLSLPSPEAGAGGVFGVPRRVRPQEPSPAAHVVERPPPAHRYLLFVAVKAASGFASGEWEVPGLMVARSGRGRVCGLGLHPSGCPGRFLGKGVW